MGHLFDLGQPLDRDPPPCRYLRTLLASPTKPSGVIHIAQAEGGFALLPALLEPLGQQRSSTSFRRELGGINAARIKPQILAPTRGLLHMAKRNLVVATIAWFLRLLCKLSLGGLLLRPLVAALRATQGQVFHKKHLVGWNVEIAVWTSNVQIDNEGRVGIAHLR